MVHASAASAKTLLRTTLRDQRKALAKAIPDAADQAAALAPLERLKAYPVIAGYRALGGELDPWPLMRRLVEAGARLALPVTLARDRPLIFRAYAPGQTLTPDALGVAAPTDAAEPLEPDLIIAPLLAFDIGGGRMGQGAGCYDRTLAELRSRRNLFVLGLAYAGQEVSKVPSEPHDQKLDAILTEKGYIAVEKDF